MDAPLKQMLSNRYFFTKGKNASDEYEQFWIRYKPARILRRRLLSFSKVENSIKIGIAVALLALLFFFGQFKVYAILAVVCLLWLLFRWSHLIAPTHVALSEDGLQLHWLRTYCSVTGPMIGWDRLSHVSIARSSDALGNHAALEFNVIGRGIPLRQRLKHLVLGPAMASGWLQGDRCAIRLKLDAIASSDDRKRLNMALKRFLPSYRIDSTVTDELNLAIRVESYTDLWLDALSGSPKRLREDVLEPGTHIMAGKYEIVRSIGGGGQALIYEAKEKTAAGEGKVSESIVVLKEFVLPAHAGVNVRKRVLGNIQREADMLKNLEHNNIVRFLDFFVDDQRAYLVLEHIDGVTHKQYVEQKGALPEHEAISLALQMCDILTNLHTLKPPLVHRDFTPDNLMLNENQVLKLIDFNVAQQLEANTTNSVVGKHAFIPPEQFRGKATTQSDIYALGGTLFFLLTGEEPEAITQGHPKEKNPGVSDEVDAIVAKATAQAASERYQDCCVLKAELQKIAACRYGK